MSNWMIYGATGYTGQLIAEEATRRGHRPILAGRSQSKLKPLAERLGLPYSAFSIDDDLRALYGLREANVELVLNCAGPFIFTAEALREACLQLGIHYLDITGEIAVFERTFALDTRARERGVVLMSGVGLDIVPSDCLIRYVAEKLPGAVSVDVAFTAGAEDDGFGQRASSGTLKSMLEMAKLGGRARRGGRIVPVDFGAHSGQFPFPGGTKSALMIPWGDVSTAYHTTGIPNISTYMALPPAMISSARYFGPLLTILLKIHPLRAWLARQIERRITGPSEATRHTARTLFYARAQDKDGKTAEAWLETPEGYHLTMLAAVNTVERVLDSTLSGAQTPAGAFGAAFVLQVPGSRFIDTLPQ